jgi:hypothetical protein
MHLGPTILMQRRLIYTEENPEEEVITEAGNLDNADPYLG